jgi:hypothetical protein
MAFPERGIAGAYGYRLRVNEALRRQRMARMFEGRLPSADDMSSAAKRREPLERSEVEHRASGGNGVVVSKNHAKGGSNNDGSIDF